MSLGLEWNLERSTSLSEVRDSKWAVEPCVMLSDIYSDTSTQRSLIVTPNLSDIPTQAVGVDQESLLVFV